MLLVVLLCSSCNADLSPNTESNPIEITDALGRRVVLPRNPTRVAALLGSFAEVWVLAGGSLCAAPNDAAEDFGLDLGNAVNLGGAHSPSLELLLSSDPQMVLASASTVSNVELREPLEAMGIPVIYFDVDSFDDYLQMLEICTQITARQDLYVKNGLRVQDQILAVKARISELNAGERVLLLRASSTSIKAKGSDGTVLGEMLADLGCVNIADRNSSLKEGLSVEAVILEDPDHIFVVAMGDNTEAAQKAVERLMEENPAWATLSAVREGNLHVMEKELFNRKPNARWGEAYEILYEILVTKA